MVQPTHICSKFIKKKLSYDIKGKRIQYARTITIIISTQTNGYIFINVGLSKSTIPGKVFCATRLILLKEKYNKKRRRSWLGCVMRYLIWSKIGR